MRDLKIERARLVGLSMGGYTALQFGLRYPEKASAIVAASVGSGSHPSQRDAWLGETSVLARIFIEHGMVSMSGRMARGPARIQLKYKDQKSWREFVVRLRQHSALGMSNTMARCQALRPSLHDLRHQFSEMTVPVLLAVGDEDVRFSNRPFGVKHFQTIHVCGVDVTRGLVLLFGIGTKALPSWDSKTRRNNLLVDLAVEERRVQADIRTHLIHRPARDIFPPLGGVRVFSYRV